MLASHKKYSKSQDIYLSKILKIKLFYVKTYKFQEKTTYI